jgi:pimeloyl-ACP methyl ester carboxylesterase
MSRPVVQGRTLVTDDGVPIDAIHLPGSQDLAIVLAHGFTLSWQRPAVWQAATWLNAAGGVVTFDFRGHGRSGGLSTLGDREIMDLAVAVAYARELGYERVAAVGFSMGASVVVRYAGLMGGVDAAVSVSGPGRWYYRGTLPMRRVHWAVERRAGRLITRAWLKTRVSPARWDPVPLPPAEAAARISPIPFLVVHGDRDVYFPVEHAEQLYEAAREPRELWVVPGFGHAESGADAGLVGQIGRWVRQAVGLMVAAGPGSAPAGTAVRRGSALRGAPVPGADGRGAPVPGADGRGAPVAGADGPAHGLPPAVTAPAAGRAEPAPAGPPEGTSLDRPAGAG